VLRSAGNPDANRNDSRRGYAVNKDWIGVLRTFGEPESWQKCVDDFREAMGSLEDRMERRRKQRKVPVQLPSGKKLKLSFGPHNELQKAIIEEFLPRYAQAAEVLYLGDTAKKIMLLEKEKLEELGFFELAHDAMPDVVAYDVVDNWLYLIEAVNTSNPISKLRHLMLERMTRNCTAPRVYVSVFKDRKSFTKWLAVISWETEVWLAESPDHLIHFDGKHSLVPMTRRSSRTSDQARVACAASRAHSGPHPSTFPFTRPATTAFPRRAAA
jgi:hypothetical protein